MTHASNGAFLFAGELWPSGSPSLPPVDRGPVNDGLRGNLDLGQVAELPEFPGGTRVLVERVVGRKCVELAGTEVVERLTRARGELSQTGLVIGRNGVARSPVSQTSRTQFETSSTSRLRHGLSRLRQGRRPRRPAPTAA